MAREAEVEAIKVNTNTLESIPMADYGGLMSGAEIIMLKAMIILGCGNGLLGTVA